MIAEALADYPWVVPLAVGVAVFLATLLGYRPHRRRGDAEDRGVVRGAAIVDSRVGREVAERVKRIDELAEYMRRVADATESMCKILKEQRIDDIAERQAEERYQAKMREWQAKRDRDRSGTNDKS